MKNIKIMRQTEREVILNVPVIGHVSLYRFSNNHPTGKPWHVTTWGRFFETPAACITFLTEQMTTWGHEDEHHPDSSRPVCHGEMTHSFLATEASLDGCP